MSGEELLTFSARALLRFGRFEGVLWMPDGGVLTTGSGCSGVGGSSGSGAVRSGSTPRPAPGRTRPVLDADIALYHVGNDPDAHGWIVDALRRQPGVVVLHDFVLHHLVAGLTIGRKDGHAYLAAMERDAGVPGRLLGYGVDSAMSPTS